MSGKEETAIDTGSVQVNYNQAPLTMSEIQIINRFASDHADNAEYTRKSAKRMIDRLNVFLRRNAAEAKVPFRVFGPTITSEIKKCSRTTVIPMTYQEFEKFTDLTVDHIHELALIGTNLPQNQDIKLRDFRKLTLDEKLGHYKETLKTIFHEHESDHWFIDLIKDIDEAIENQNDIFSDYLALSEHMVMIYRMAVIHKEAPSRFAALIEEEVGKKHRVSLIEDRGWYPFLKSVEALDESLEMKREVSALRITVDFLEFCDEDGQKWASAQGVRGFIKYAKEVAVMNENYAYGTLSVNVKARAGFALLTFLASQQIECPLNYHVAQFMRSAKQPFPLTSQEYDTFLNEFDEWVGSSKEVWARLR